MNWLVRYFTTRAMVSRRGGIFSRIAMLIAFIKFLRRIGGTSPKTIKTQQVRKGDVIIVNAREK